MRLLGYLNLKAVLELKSPSHIGTGEKDIEKGAPSPVIKSKQNGMPYIPGSSIKGKMRFLLEMSQGRKETDPKDSGSPCWCGKCQICLLFGSGSSKNTFEPSRLIFRDVFLTESSVNLIEKTGLENKPGVRIDRNTGKAASGPLFLIERIPEGVEFDTEISIRLFENDDKESIIKWLEAGLFLMEQDAIGGSGTRGSGWIKIKQIEIDGKNIPDWRDEAKQYKDKLLKVNIKK